MNLEIKENCRYSKFKGLKELTKLFTIDVGDGTVRYEKMCQRGDLEFFDYGRGFLNVEIYPSLDIYGEKDANGKFVNYFCRMWFATIDDGDFGGWAGPMSKEKAQDLCKRIAHEVFEDMVGLPNTEELNKTLRPYGMYVNYE